MRCSLGKILRIVGLAKVSGASGRGEMITPDGVPSILLFKYAGKMSYTSKKGTKGKGCGYNICFTVLNEYISPE
jgi:hypothetical protein